MILVNESTKQDNIQRLKTTKAQFTSYYYCLVKKLIIILCQESVNVSLEFIEFTNPINLIIFLISLCNCIQKVNYNQFQYHSINQFVLLATVFILKIRCLNIRQFKSFFQMSLSPRPFPKPSYSPLSHQTHQGQADLFHLPSEYHHHHLPHFKYHNLPQIESPLFLDSESSWSNNTFKFTNQHPQSYKRVLFQNQSVAEPLSNKTNKYEVSLTVKILQKQVDQLESNQKTLKRMFENQINDLISQLNKCDQQQNMMKCEMVEMKTLMRERKCDLEMIRNACQTDDDDPQQNQQNYQNIQNQKEAENQIRSLSNRPSRSKSNRTVINKNRKGDCSKPKTPYRLPLPIRKSPRNQKKTSAGGLFVPSTPRLFY